MGIYNDEYMFHTGVKGMKWGKRMKDRAPIIGKTYKNAIKHPIYSTAAQISLLKTQPKKAIRFNLETNKKLNKDVDDMIKNKKEILSKKDKIKIGAAAVALMFASGANL